MCEQPNIPTNQLPTNRLMSAIFLLSSFEYRSSVPSVASMIPPLLLEIPERSQISLINQEVVALEPIEPIYLLKGERWVRSKQTKCLKLVGGITPQMGWVIFV